MEDVLQKLDKQLTTLRSDYYQKLNPPLSDSALESLEKQYNVEIPHDLKLLYRWKNGQDPDCYESFVNNSMFVPLEEVLDTAELLTSMIGTDFEIKDWWNEKWMPIFHNGGGSRICYDMGGIFTGQSGQLIEFWKGDNDRNVIASTLKEFLLKLSEYYDATSIEDFDKYFAIGNVDGFPKEFKVE